jgi:putative transposase
MVADPVDYAWSSHRCHAFGVPDPLITPHPALARLGHTAEAQRRNYRELVMQAIDPEETDTIRRHVQHQRIYGPDRFRLVIERQLGRKLGPKKIGRPKKASIETNGLSESRL